jgi:hypothetical protein
MRINCGHGFFLFEEDEPGEIGRFSSVYGTDLVSMGAYATFEALAEAEEYSLAGKNYLNLPAIKTFEGDPWEIFEENGFVYSLNLGLVVPLTTIIAPITLQTSDLYYVSTALIQPGSPLASGDRIVSYKAHLDRSMTTLKYTEIEYL